MPGLHKILCVDDEQDILDIAKLSLEAIGGFEVLTCTGSHRALEKFASFRPDLVLLDVMMPDLDGPAILAAIRQLEGGEAVPALFMTAKVQPAEKAAYLKMGAIGVISKPFDPMTLPEDIQALWSENHAAR